MPTRVIGYLRVSTDDQKEKGVSIEAQRAKVQGYAAIYDLELVDVIDEAASASTLERPGLKWALGRIARGDADGLLVAKLDRLTRSVVDLGMLVAGPFADGRAKLLAVDDHVDTRTPMGRLMLNLVASISQWERENGAARTRAALQHKRAVGERTGSVPFGYTLAGDGVHLLEHDEEQRCVRAACALRGAGLSLRQVAEELERLGHMARNGRRLSAQQVKRMLARAASQQDGRSARVDAASEPSHCPV